MADPNVERTIRRVARRKRASPKEVKAAIETGLVESHLTNPPGGTGDSAGWRQERRSLYPDPTSVTHSAERFFDEAKRANVPGISAGELAARVQRPAAQYRGRYDDAAAQAEQILHGLSGVPYSPAAGSVGSRVVNSLREHKSLDTGAFDDAKRMVLVGRLLAKRHGTDTPLFQSGVLSTTDPNPADFMRSTLTGSVHSSRAGAKSMPGLSLVAGKVDVAPGANRHGVGLQPILKSYVSAVAGRARRPITITTGTNHNRMTVDGNVSDHWDGHAADIGVAVDSQAGDLIAAHALQVAGIPWKRAIGMAQRGGLYTIKPTSGRFKGRRVQVIWRTDRGGNHHTHVHLGVADA